MNPMERVSPLVDILGEDNFRLVGGCVRDSLLTNPVKDIDVATVFTPDVVVEKLAKAGISTIPTGIEHGTVTALINETPIEITTLRKDVSTDGRRATVEFSTNWEEDAARRDFTINALYQHPINGQIFDYFDGINDLTKERVRFIGDARERIKEDYLRILRFYRFCVRFGEINREDSKACAELREGLRQISAERIYWELLNILSSVNDVINYFIIDYMYHDGIFDVILPEVTPRTLDNLVHLIWKDKRADPVLRLAALLPPRPDIVANVADRLKVPNKVKERLIVISEPTILDPDELSYRIGADNAFDRLRLWTDQTLPSCFKEEVFPIKGQDVVDLGFEPGPIISKILKEVEEIWIARYFPSINDTMKILNKVAEKYKNEKAV